MADCTSYPGWVATNEHKADTCVPILDSIPVEILYHIFEQYLAENSTKVMNLQLVSRAWCAIVNSHPPLWIRIDVTSPFRSGYGRACKRYIDLCTERSGNLDLHVLFRSSSISPKMGIAQDNCLLPNDINVFRYLCSKANARWISFSYVDMSRHHLYILPESRHQVLRLGHYPTHTKTSMSPSRRRTSGGAKGKCDNWASSG